MVLCEDGVVMVRLDRNLEASELCDPEAAKERITCECVRMRSVKVN